jgi:hypothetical protein
MPMLRDVPGTTWVLFIFALIVVAGGLLLIEAIAADPVSAEAVAAMVTAGLGVFAIHIGHVTGHQQARGTIDAVRSSTSAADSRLTSTRFATRPPAHRTSSEAEWQMQREFDALTDLNLQIGRAETAGDKKSLEKLLAPVLAFRRANGDCVDKQDFLENVAKGAPRKTAIESIDLVGRDRAIVTCVVSMVDGEQQKSFHNIRLFVRMQDDWKLLGWANEPV